MLFKYVALDKKGKKIKSSIEALSLDEAKTRLKSRNLLYISIKADIFSSLYKYSFKKSSQIKRLDLSYISRDLSLYLDAGISLIQAIKLLSQQHKKNKKNHLFFETIEHYLEEGSNFFTALEQQKIFELPEFYKQSIKVSENGGMLSQVLSELATFLKEQDRVKKQTASAMAYPMFILVVSFLMVGFMLSFIVPKISSIFEQTDNELPKITSFIIELGEFFSNYYFSLFCGFIFTVFAFTTLIKKSQKFKYSVDTILLKVPLFKEFIEFNELSRFSYMNSILIRSGVPIVQSIKLSANILNNSVIKRLFVQSSEKVVAGERLSKILSASDVFSLDSSFIHAIAIGEETSELSKILNNLAQLYNESNKDKIGVMLSLLEPMLMLIVGGLIGFIVFSMLLPIFSMNLG